MPPGTLAPDIDRGRRIGKYEILTRLSMGGMAELFLGYTAGPGGFRKFVAVKQILPDIKADESFVKMFLDEARITAAFSNANIGQVYDLGETEGELFLAMEFISGQNLEQIIKRAAKREIAVPIGFACRVVHDSVLGLHYAHHFQDHAGRPTPVVHRDVSPKNVMVTYTGDVKMIDFGIAKAKNRLNRTQIGIVKGTSGYMSPEQVKNEPLDGRTDLFAAAVMLHEMLTAARLFTAPTDAAMMLKIVEGEIEQPKNVNPAVSAALSDVVMKGLARKREHRFASGKEFARAIEQACPEMYDEDQSAALMAELFDDKIQTTRALLELANSNDTGSLTKAVEQLTAKDDIEASTTTPRGRKGPAKATPAPRPGIKKATNQSKRDLRPVDDATAPPRRPPLARDDLDATIPPKSKATNHGRGPAKPRVEEPEPDQTPPPAPKKKASQPVAPVADEPIGIDTQQQMLPKKSGGSGLIVTVLLLVVVGGAGFAAWKVPAIHALIEKELSGETPPPPPPTNLRDLAPKKDKPQFVIDKEKADALAKAEADRQAAVEAAQNDPDRKRMLAELEAQISQLDKLEDEQRQLKIDAKTSHDQGASNTKKIEDLEKKINALQASIDEKKKKAAVKKPGDGEVEIVRDKKSAAQHAVGYLSLRTVNPSNAAVFEGEVSLGSTPLTKVPLDEGTHKLRVVDGESKNRMLSITLKGGQTLEMKGVDVQSLPMQ